MSEVKRFSVVQLCKQAIDFWTPRNLKESVPLEDIDGPFSLDEDMQFLSLGAFHTQPPPSVLAGKPIEINDDEGKPVRVRRLLTAAHIFDFMNKTWKDFVFVPESNPAARFPLYPGNKGRLFPARYIPRQKRDERLRSQFDICVLFIVDEPIKLSIQSLDNELTPLRPTIQRNE